MNYATVQKQRSKESLFN